MTIFFTADSHFGHAAIIGHCSRPFPSVEVMDRTMVERWNAVVGARDEVWVVGDFAHGHKATEYRMDRIFKALNGSKHLVVGNHDGAETKKLPWASVRDGCAVVTAGDATVVAFHYPMRSWPHAAHGAIHVFGHVHGRLSDTDRSCDVGVDRWDFTPVTVERIRERMAMSPPSPDYPEGEA